MSLLNEFNKKQRAIISLIFVLAMIGIVTGFIIDAFQSERELTSLQRPEPYEEEIEVHFNLRYQGEEGEKTLKYKGLLGERILEETKQNASLNKALDIVERGMFREGENEHRVVTGLNIPNRIEKNPAVISWEVEKSEFFDGNGNLNFEKLGVEPINTKLTIKAEYEEKEVKREYSLKILPKTLTEAEKEVFLIHKELDNALKSTDKEEMILPQKIGEVEVFYAMEKKEVAPGLAGIGVLAVILSYFYFKNENVKKKEKREEDLKRVYPYFVGRFVILLGAGLNILSIWQRLEKTENFNESLSEEIKLTIWEINNGKTEREAYENFGKRIGGVQYPKFVSILTENLKMGSSQILTRLSGEAKEAILQRRNSTREIGEKMGTKFLLPMVVELVLIMLIIMLPAMMSVGN